MSVASSLSKLAFCRQLARTPGSFLRLVLHSKAATKRGVALALAVAPDTGPVEYLLNLANAPNGTALRTYADDLSILYEIFWQ